MYVYACMCVWVCVFDNQSRKRSFVFGIAPSYYGSSGTALAGTSSTTETASAVVVVDVDELVVLAGDMLSALPHASPIGGGELVAAAAIAAAVAVDS